MVKLYYLSINTYIRALLVLQYRAIECLHQSIAHSGWCLHYCRGSVKRWGVDPYTAVRIHVKFLKNSKKKPKWAFDPGATW